MPQKKGPTPRKRTIRMMVIPEPEPDSRAIIHFTGEGTVAMRGPGKTKMECGQCGKPLLVGVSISQIQNLVFICNACGAYNETLA